ncbi:hypothetical protein Metev_0377 [Methanohalobium evestigatum Z-7303]|uniref:FG-GAP repeat protein n=1 Tax=Methanohalobium evestigatum (strain ATCC BAA-1072 / DSM 3721 / NBRC 107634 / OCM 161 / Z-7303) TaxID=644295 RepID=D7E6S7_METEZ|nr:VCBS repeat-containing protein [Methanohalobium evestigatum]ADI73299.1 hypothetical protein Metev_0377 [Methanohalobium evestigatum Z-7303]
MDKRKLIIGAILVITFIFSISATTADDINSIGQKATKGFEGFENLPHGNPEYTRSLSVTDINNDGIKDIVVYKHGVNYLYEGTETGKFEGYKIHDNSDHTNSLSVCDINRDGNNDIMAGNDGINYWYEGDGTGEFTRNVARKPTVLTVGGIATVGICIFVQV